MSLIYCIGCKASEPFRWRGESPGVALRVEDLPRGWVLRVVADETVDATRERLTGRTTWVLCKRCALALTPVLHPVVRHALEGIGR